MSATSFTSAICGVGLAFALSTLLISPVAAQNSAPAASEQSVPEAGDRNPHQMLDELNGGPDGSPTSSRGNPRPGTSTSIPGTNPAPVAPIPSEQGDVKNTENTGIDGQCDPVVSLGKCPNQPTAQPKDAEAGK